MLKQRLITAVILLVLFLSILFYAPPPLFCMFTEVVTLWGAWEWSRLMGLKKPSQRIFYVLFILILLQAIFFSSIPFNWCLYFFYLVLFFWVMMIALIALYPRALFWKKSILTQAVIGMFVFIPCWFGINFIRDIDVHGQYLLLFLFILVWSADSVAYFAGRKWGKTVLAPHVSPGKTKEGVYAAGATGLVVTFIPLVWFGVPYSLWAYTLGLSLMTVLFSVVGDLLESMFKRSEGLKDSGHLLPGHGGLLDRVDSLTAAVPIFTLGAILLSRMS